MKVNCAKFRAEYYHDNIHELLELLQRLDCYHFLYVAVTNWK